jgi:hypothetical protein
MLNSSQKEKFCPLVEGMQSDGLSVQNNEMLSKEQQIENMCSFSVVLCVTSARGLCSAVFVLRGSSKLGGSVSNEKLVVAKQVEKCPSHPPILRSPKAL